MNHELKDPRSTTFDRFGRSNPMASGCFPGSSAGLWAPRPFWLRADYPNCSHLHRQFCGSQWKLIVKPGRCSFPEGISLFHMQQVFPALAMSGRRILASFQVQVFLQIGSGAQALGKLDNHVAQEKSGPELEAACVSWQALGQLQILENELPQKLMTTMAPSFLVHVPFLRRKSDRRNRTSRARARKLQPMCWPTQLLGSATS